MSNDQKQFLLIGGSGFIGRHLCIRLLSEDYSVTVVSRSPSKEFMADFGHITHVVDLATFNKRFEEIICKITHIIYLASDSVPTSNMENLTLEMNKNLLPSSQLFEKTARFAPSAKLVYISSGGTIYGHTSETPVNEESDTRPVNPYGMCKLLAEMSLDYLARTQNMDISIIRPSNPVGRWQLSQNQGFISVASRLHKIGKPIVIYGDGTQIRDYLDVDDLAEAILKISLDTKYSNNMWNVGSGIGHSLREILDILAEVSGRRPIVEYRPGRSCDVQYNVLDISKIKNLLHWQPTKDIHDIAFNMWESIEPITKKTNNSFS